MEYIPSFRDNLQNDTIPNWRDTLSDELYHHGIKGMHWGVRRPRNEDGIIQGAGASLAKQQKKLKKQERKQKKAFLKKVDNEQKEYFYSQLRPEVRPYVRLGRNGYDQRDQSWNEAFRKGIVTSKDSDQIRSAARKTRQYTEQKYGKSVKTALAKSDELFRKDYYDEFDLPEQW